MFLSNLNSESSRQVVTRLFGLKISSLRLLRKILQRYDYINVAKIIERAAEMFSGSGLKSEVGVFQRPASQVMTEKLRKAFFLHSVYSLLSGFLMM